MHLGTRLARNALTALQGQAAVSVAALITTGILVRALGAAQFGAWSLIGAVAAYGALFDLGLGVALVRRAALAHTAGDRHGLLRALSAALLATTLLGVVAALTVVLLAEPLATLLRIPAPGRADFVLALRVTGVAIGLTLPGVALGAIPTALQRMDMVIRLETAVALVTLTAQACLALTGGTLTALACAAAAARLVSLVGRAWLVRRLIPRAALRVEWGYPFWPELGRFGLLKLVHQITSQLVLHIDRFLVAALVSVPAVAYYTVAVELAQKLLVVQSNVSAAYYPAACAAAAASDRLQAFRQLYRRTSRGVALLTLPLAAALAVLAAPVLHVWVGAAFADASTDLLRVLAVAYAGMALTAIPAGAADALGRPDVPLRYGLVSIVLHVALALLLIPHWGILGAGFAILGNVVLQTPWFIRTVTRRLVGIPLVSYAWRVIGGPSLPALALALVLILVLGATSAAGFAAGPVALALGAGAGVVSYLTAVRFLGTIDADERRVLAGARGGRLLLWLTGSA